jgi:hypothetical protein
MEEKLSPRLLFQQKATRWFRPAGFILT